MLKAANTFRRNDSVHNIATPGAGIVQTATSIRTTKTD